jgi:hypothetical protein
MQAKESSRNTCTAGKVPLSSTSAIWDKFSSLDQTESNFSNAPPSVIPPVLTKSDPGSSKEGMNECYLTMFLNPQAGIIDDAIACNNEKEEIVRLVVNGANKYIVVDHLRKVIDQEKYNVKLEHLEDYGLVAFQGPKSAEILQKVIEGQKLEEVPFMT